MGKSMTEFIGRTLKMELSGIKTSPSAHPGRDASHAQKRSGLIIRRKL